ncbi:MAG TPA: GNAT family N-acetyltransferase [Labilithrix sp.]|nr:GNAT family N-acetyltransferase [Labilithrix sp.]
MSKRLWDLEWSEHLPWTIDGVSVEQGTSEDALAFIEAHYAGIFGVQSERFVLEKMTEAKRRFWAEMDIFLFRLGGKTVGLSAGHPSDWSTYYIRTLALLPAARERRFATDFTDALGNTLAKVGVVRVDAECSPTNTPIMRLLLRLGYLVTATTNSDRWGALVRLTKFFGDDAANAFRRQYIYDPTFQMKDTPNHT